MYNRKLFTLFCTILFLLCCYLHSTNNFSRVQADTGKPIGENTLVFKSLDGGTTWVSTGDFGKDLLAHQVHQIVVDPVHTSTIYLTTNNGIFKSTDDGANWQRRSNGLPSLVIRDLKIDPLNPENLYVIVGHIYTSEGASYRSRDGGQNWQKLIVPPDPSCMAIDPVDSATIYVGVRRRDSAGIYKSTNGGDTFRFIQFTQHGFSNSLLIEQIEIDPKIPSSVYTWHYEAGVDGIYRSVDGGESLSPSTALFSQFALGTFLMDPQSSSILYLGTQDGLMKSFDGGTNWNIVNQSSDRPSVMAIDNFSTLYARTRSGILMKSFDGGVSFTATRFNRDFTVLGLDPKNASVIYTSNPLAFPQIENVTVEGKSLVITGRNIHEGTVVEIDSVPQVTKIDFQQSPVRLIAKKAFKRLTPGQKVLVNIREADGVDTNVLSYTKPL